MNQTEILRYYRLSEAEYIQIKSLLGHSPSRLELALFSALWSEHCSYKSSSVHLKKLFFPSSKVLSGLGENAGVVDLGEGEKVAFKIESHNHPSFISPYHGAATGVGGILRDVFVMNARPMALANYLCFGEPDVKPTDYLVEGVIEGIGGYGNSIGIPMVTGQTEFHSSYNKNVVVNALALGYFGPDDKVMSSMAKGEGNWLVYVGAHTGRDGIHGASMASESFGKTQSSNTCVQIGDPFYGKLLMEGCLAVMKKNLVVAAQDMGAAGIISSSFEMISKGSLGMRLQLDQVPLRDSTMTAEEILLSESQERVLLLVEPQKYKELEKILLKWELLVCKIGELTKNQEVELFWDKELLLTIDPSYLTKKAPYYSRPYKKWISSLKVSQEKWKSISKPPDRKRELLTKIFKDIRGSSRKFIYRQYDQRVGASTVKDCSFPLGVIRLPHSERALGICVGGRPHVMRMDSFEGGKDTVFETALQLASRGFYPLALTDGLNFGSPEKKEVMSSFVACVEGMAEASKSLDTPVVSGNVSFYNETKGKNISPTPAVVMVGLKNTMEIPSATLSSLISPEDKQIYLVSAHQIFCFGMLGEFLNQEPGVFSGEINSKVCREFIQGVLKASLAAPPEALYQVGKFGLAYSLARMLVHEKAEASSLGMEIETRYRAFEERLYEIVVVLKKSDVPTWTKFIESSGGKIEQIGVFTDKTSVSFNGDVLINTEDIKRESFYEKKLAR